MKTSAPKRICRSTGPALTLLALLATACIAQSTPVPFADDFSGPLDPAWNQTSYTAGHIGIVAGSYYMTAKQGGGFNPKLSRADTGDAAPLSSYIHEIDVVLNPFGLTGSGGTLSDFKWKSFGPDGFMEIVLNSFGNMRLFHNEWGTSGGNLRVNIPIGYSDGDLLSLKTVYTLETDTLDITYALNGGVAVPFYSGGGINGPVGDLISNFVEVEIFKWGSSAGEPVIAIDRWDLVPEPSSIALLGLISGLGVFIRRFLIL